MSDTSVTQRIVDFLFPQQVWGPATNIIMTGMKTGYYVALVAFLLYGMYWFVTSWIESYKVTRLLYAFPLGFIVFFVLIIIVLVIIGYMIGGISIFGYDIFRMSACDSDHPDKNGGLCYKNCDEGYHGVGPVCWADTYGVGAGTVIGLSSCPAGQTDFGLFCLGWDSCKYRTIIGCIGGFNSTGKTAQCPGPTDFGDLFDSGYNGKYSAYNTSKSKPDPSRASETDKERLLAGHKTKEDEDTVRDKHRDLVDGLCYKECRAGEMHLPGMPYLCIKQQPGTDKPIPLSYGRGVGLIPHWMKFFDKEQAKYVL